MSTVSLKLTSPDANVIAWLKEQDNKSKSLELAIKFFIAHYGEGNAVDALIAQSLRVAKPKAKRAKKEVVLPLEVEEEVAVEPEEVAADAPVDPLDLLSAGVNFEQLMSEQSKGLNL